MHITPSEWIMCELGVCPNFLENNLLKVDKILGLTFYRTRKDFKGFKNDVCPFTVAELFARCIVYNSRLFAYKRPFRELRVSYKEKFGPIIKVNFWQTNLRANVCRYSTLQVNRKTNATGRRRLTSSNRAAIFVSTSREERHNKRWKNLFGYELGESTENNKGLLFSEVRKQFKL